MQRHASARIVRIPVVVALVALAACGGGGDDEPSGGAEGSPTDSLSAATSPSGDAGAEPGQAWAEVGGERLVYESSGSINYTCQADGEVIAVNFVSGVGQDLSIQSVPQGDDWIGQRYFTPGGPGNVVYSVSLGTGDGVLAAADGEISYVGTVTRIEGTDLANAEDLDAEIAINCASAGADPAAVIDGQNYEFPATGAQSFDCTVAPDRVLVRVNRLGTDGQQLEVDARQEGGNWIGSAVVYDVDDTFTSAIEPDGAGLEIDGSSVSYTGMFAGRDGVDVDGTADVTCP